MDDSTSTIIVSGLPPSTSPEEFGQHFQNIGPIQIDKRTGQPMVASRVETSETGLNVRTAILTYTNPESAREAVKALNGQDLGGYKIGVQTAEQYYEKRRSVDREFPQMASQPIKHLNNWIAWRLWSTSNNYRGGSYGQAGEDGKAGRGPWGGKGGRGGDGGVYNGNWGYMLYGNGNNGRGGKGGQGGGWWPFGGQSGQDGEDGSYYGGGQGGKGGSGGCIIN